MERNKNNLLNKKILLISSWAPPQIGGAQNLYNLFINIDSKDYCILTSENNLKDSKLGGKSLSCKYYFFKSTKGKLYKFFNATKIGYKIIKQDKIDMVMGISDGGFSFLITFLLSKITRKPYCIFLFDIWRGNIFAIKNEAVNFFEPIFFKKAKKILVTNEATKKYYQEMYAGLDEFEIIHNSTFSNNYEKIGNKKTNNEPIKVVFTGNIYWPQKDSIINLIKLIKSQKDSNIYLDIYCPNVPKEVMAESENNKKIKFLYSSPDEMPKIQSEADILFLPFSWNTDAPDIIKTASPGKLTDYLIAGRPILIHAPEYSFVAKYAKENKFAEVVDVNEISTLREAILRLATDKDYSNSLVENAKKTFYKNHNAVDNAKKLVNIINNI